VTSHVISAGPGVHGFFLFGTRVLFASHMPMFRVSVQWTREIWPFVEEAGGWKINGMIFNHKPAPG
jgi:hypothetical protein